MIIQSKKNQVKHNLSRHPLYRRYINIISRCSNKNDKDYERYGKKGVSVSPNWFNGIDHSLIGNFIRDVEPLYSEAKLKYPNQKLSIDRINNDGNYEIDNIRFTTYKVQIHNRSNSLKIENLIGRKSGRLTIKSSAGYRKSRLYVNCSCDCGNMTTVSYGNFQSKRVMSCGCLNKEYFASKRTVKIGDRFGYWIVVDLNYIVNKYGALYYKVRCMRCNNTEKYVRLDILRNSTSTMCKSCAVKRVRLKKKQLKELKQQGVNYG